MLVVWLRVPNDTHTGPKYAKGLTPVGPGDVWPH